VTVEERSRAAAAGADLERPTPAWLVVAGGECRDLWVGGRGPALIFGYSVLLSVVTYLLATNRVLNYLEQREAVNLAVQVAVSVGVLLKIGRASCRERV